jgi:solute:Na+ symporter, SSS family
MAPLDWAVLLAYLVGITGFGLWAGRGNRRLDDFFLAGRGMRWWAIGLSVMATEISAITFIGTTGQGYTEGMRFLVVYFGLPFAIVILCATLVPSLYRARVVTAYEYLERRFDARTRTLTSLLFLLSRGMAVGVTLYAASLVLAVILGWSATATVLLIGGSTILYVVYGGNRSVIWTGVVQMGILWLGVVLCFGIAIAQIPVGFHLRDALALAQSTGRLQVMDTTPSLTRPYTLWSGLIGGLFLMLSHFGCDQSQVQRYLSGSDLAQSRLSLLFNAFLKVPMQFVILLTGVLVFVFYHFHRPPLLWNPAEMARLERDAPPAALEDLKLRFYLAHQARRVAAEGFADRRHSGRPADPREYVEAQRGLDAVRAEALALAVQTRVPVEESSIARRLRRLAPAGYDDTNHIFPSYVIQLLPAGVAGLVIAAILAAAMSTLSGELSSLAAASVVDFYKRHVNANATDAAYLLASRLATAAWGLFACVIALRAGALGSAVEVVNRFGSFFYGPILGVFGLAVLTRAGAAGAFFGLFAGMAAVALVSVATRVHFLWYSVVGAVVVFFTGLLVTALAPRRT